MSSRFLSPMVPREAPYTTASSVDEAPTASFVPESAAEPLRTVVVPVQVVVTIIRGEHHAVMV